MLKTVLKQVGRYRTAALLTPLWTTAEVIMGVLIPYVTASIIDKGINAGDLVEIDIPEPEVLDIQPEDIPLDIVYEDDDVIVVNKPRGMVVHPGPGNWSGTLVNAIMYHCGDSLSSINGVVRPGIVHRIDKDTSGLLMIAKNDRAHESLAEQLRVHSVTREYTALVYDNIVEDEITISAPIGRDERNRMRRAVGGIYNNDYGDTGYGYYFARGEMEEAYEMAAFALAEYDVSEVLETDDGFYIIMRLPKDGDYIERNFQSLKEQSYFIVLNGKVEEKLADMPLEWNKTGAALDLADLPAIHANGGAWVPVAFWVGVGVIAVLAAVLIVGLARRKRIGGKKKKK